ncbi:MAG: class II aldolase/adducin family protein [Lachnospiraceae bacterium]|nr:class II aldolase/adducin family protein [Lachnospiraceae bacterium]
MTDREAKLAILDVGRRMYERGYVAANDGNISCRVSENEIWSTPTGVSKGFMTEEMLIKTDLSGTVLEGTMRPSSELKMHLRVYREDPSLQAVVHAHPPIATAFAVAGIPLDRPVLTEAAMALGNIPVAPYATPGTQEVPDSIAPFVRTHNGCLLANHGALSWGKDMYQAYYRLESIEYYAGILMNTVFVMGRWKEVPRERAGELLEIRKRLGVDRGGDFIFRGDSPEA